MAVDIPGGILRQSDIRETITNTAESSVAWNFSFARYEGKLTIADAFRAVFFSPDGFQFYIATDTDDIRQFTMSVRWDITTGTPTHTLDVSAKEIKLMGVFFKPDGTKMYTLGDDGNSVDEYDLSTPWLLSSALYLQELDISGTIAEPTGMYLRDDGKRMYIHNEFDNKIYSYFLETPWDVTTGVVVENITTVSGGGITLSRDGNHVFIVSSNTVRKWNMTSVFDISTASAHSTFDTAPAVTLVAVFFKPNGSQMYAANVNQIQQYSIRRGWK